MESYSLEAELDWLWPQVSEFFSIVRDVLPYPKRLHLQSDTSGALGEQAVSQYQYVNWDPPPK